MGLFLGRRETLNEQLAREAGLAPQREPRRPRWGKRKQIFKLVKYAGKPDYLSEQEALPNRENFRLRAPDTPPPGFG